MTCFSLGSDCESDRLTSVTYFVATGAQGYSEYNGNSFVKRLKIHTVYNNSWVLVAFVLTSLAFTQRVFHTVASELLVVVNEGERKVDIEWVGSVRGCCPLPRLKCNHEVNPSSWPFNLKLVDEILAKDFTQELLKLIVNSKRTVGTTWRSEILSF